MKYYSEILDTVFDTEGALKDAEASYYKDKSAKDNSSDEEIASIKNGLAETCESLRDMYKEYLDKYTTTKEYIQRYEKELASLNDTYSAPLLKYIFREGDSTISDKRIAKRCHELAFGSECYPKHKKSVPISESHATNTFSDWVDFFSLF